MARKVFVSFRYDDGSHYKDELVNLFDDSTEIINRSEDKDRSDMSDETIKKYLYDKLKDTSVTIVLITPEAVNHKKNIFGFYDDWMYDEIRYSLEDRENNRSNGLIAVYTDEARPLIMYETIHSCNNCNGERKIKTIKHVNNLFRENMMNVKSAYKKDKCDNVYDMTYDSYCSLVPWDDFVADPEYYIEKAAEKRENIDHYEITKDLNKKD